VHQEFGGRGVVELGCGLGGLDNPTDGAAHAARGGVKTLATRAVRAAHAGPASSAMYTWLFVQESRAQVRVRNSRNDGGECLLRKGVQGLLGDLGA
jgi:hypothetical protein